MKLAMKIASHAQALSIALASLIIILLIAGGYGYWWAQDQLIAKQSDLAKHQLSLVDEQKRTDQLVQLSRRYNDAKTKLDDIDKALPHASQQAELLLEVQEAANQTGVKLPSILFTGSPQLANPSLNQATKLSDLYVVPISLRLTATYTQLNAFLSRLERLSRYNSVGTLSLTKTNSNRDNLDVSMTLNAYFKP